ncbi:MAG: peptidylprolyl isomerase [Candidatus Kerfeldbacteria bacterium]|nr:peptidylprolyl isomerase [Candidatus Kerfeldbacteria bacterium]
MQSRFVLLAAGIIIAAAAVLNLTQYRLPARSVDLSSNSANRITNNHTNVNTSTLIAPGILPSEQIHNQQARIVTNKGEFIIALADEQAPLAVSSFIYLAKQGFYDGLRWHRVEPGFVVQGGDPLTRDDDRLMWGRGGPGYTFADETVTGAYTAGTVAMANRGPDTNGSQFFIVLADQPGLPKNYTIFGRVSRGSEVVPSLAVGDEIRQVVIEPRR